MKTNHLARFAALLCLLGVLLHPLPTAAAGEPVRYNRSAVTELYSLDYANRAYHRVTGQADIAAAVKQIRGVSFTRTPRPDAVGFLLFLANGDKFTFYGSPSETGSSAAVRGMVALSQEMNARYPASVQWFAFMSVENIQEISFAAYRGWEDEFRVMQRAPSNAYALSVITDDAGEIARVAAYLKGMQVGPQPAVSENEGYLAPSSDNHYDLTIRFRDQVQYRIAGPSLTISATGMPEWITYEIAFEQIDGLCDLMAGMGRLGPDSMVEWEIWAPVG